jgi:hypothetical protein
MLSCAGSCGGGCPGKQQVLHHLHSIMYMSPKCGKGSPGVICMLSLSPCCCCIPIPDRYLHPILTLPLQVLSGFQTFGAPTFLPVQGSNRGPSHLHPCMQGLQYAVRCLAQLTATQYAATTCHQPKKLDNQGRIIFVCSLKK